MKLSLLERIVYDHLVSKSKSKLGVSIDDLITVAYKDQEAPFNARASLTSILRQLSRKADHLDLPYKIERVSSIARLGRYRATPRTVRRPSRAKGSQRQAVAR